MKLLAFLIVLAGASVALAAARADTVEVSQKGRKFVPDSVSIHTGDTVRIRNDDEFLHHLYVNAPGFSFDSEEQPPGHTVDIQFTKDGDFKVMCRIHPKMLLTVHVSPHIQ